MDDALVKLTYANKANLEVVDGVSAEIRKVEKALKDCPVLIDFQMNAGAGDMEWNATSKRLFYIASGEPRRPVIDLPAATRIALWKDCLLPFLSGLTEHIKRETKKLIELRDR